MKRRNVIPTISYVVNLLLLGGLFSRISYDRTMMSSLQNQVRSQNHEVASLKNQLTQSNGALRFEKILVSSLTTKNSATSPATAKSPGNQIVSSATSPPSSIDNSTLGLRFSNFTWQSSQDSLTCTITNVSNQVQTLTANDFVLQKQGANTIYSGFFGSPADGFMDQFGSYSLESVQLLPGDQAKWYGGFQVNHQIAGYELYYIDGSQAVQITKFN